MENEIGEYGRTNLGKIIKFAWLEDEKGKKYENKVILVDLMLKETYPYYYFKKGEYIVKHSPNLIDLIQCGDYVNGKKVTEIKEWNSSKDGFFRYAVTCHYEIIRTDEIKIIVTKEQFESISYKL